MPTYIVRAPRVVLNDTTKQRLAECITAIHSKVTSGFDAFTQVLFHGTETDDCYIGGTLLQGPHCFIQGHIRAGRSALDRADLIRTLLPTVSDLLGVPRYAIWIYLSELPPRAMAEFGYILPEQGDDEMWLASLPPEDRRRLDGLSRQATRTEQTET